MRVIRQGDREYDRLLQTLNRRYKPDQKVRAAVGQFSNLSLAKEMMPSLDSPGNSADRDWTRACWALVATNSMPPGPGFPRTFEKRSSPRNRMFAHSPNAA